MIYLVANIHSARLHYTTDLIFSELMGKDYRVISPENAKTLPETSIILNYSNEEIGNYIQIPNEGLLDEDFIRKEEPALKWEGGFPYLFPDNSTKEEGPGFDLLSAAFYLASGYAYYQADQFDRHGRYEESALFTFRNQLHKSPWVHHYANYLGDLLKAYSSEIHVNLPRPDYEITWDVDHPWAFRNKSFVRQLGGGVKDLVKGDFLNFRKRWKSLNDPQTDPFDTFNLIRQYSPVEKTTLFFLINGKSKYDNRFGKNNLAFRQLIKELDAAGYSTGIHPSYESCLQPDLLKSEKQMLEEILGKSITKSRQHYLKFRLPDTFEALIESGIKEDYSFCPIYDTGFLLGMAKPFSWFNLAKNEATSLTINPTLVMDRTLQQYLQLNPEGGKERIKEIQQQVFEAGGKFIILLHNEALSDFKEWEGWQTVFLEFLEDINEHFKV